MTKAAFTNGQGTFGCGQDQKYLKGTGRMNITIRLAWHSNGWNGHICDEPEKNTYCIGRHSYPGDYIKGARDLKWETDTNVKGKPCGLLTNGLPACGVSINAFGNERTKAQINPPAWFNAEAKPAIIDIPESTVCIWNYEGMYSDDVVREAGSTQKYNYDTRLENAKNYFSGLKEGHSLLFYYANYSNPFSEDESPKYAIIGLSRLKKVGRIHYYAGVSEEVKAKYAGGFVWQMPLTSNYPDEGFSIPYHKYMDRPEVLERILLVPDNPRNFKYATRPISDDDALALVERLIEIVNYLIEIADDSQNWLVRRDWLFSLFTELWKKRGAYPGLPEVMAVIDFHEAIDYYKKQVAKGQDKLAYNNIKEFLSGTAVKISDVSISTARLKEVKRNWKLREEIERELLLGGLTRFALTRTQIENVLSANRDQNSIYASLEKINENPYLICEQYVGDDVDDIISFHAIDHGVIPNPDLGIDNLYPKNAAERFRALCVDVLKRETVHSFVSQTKVLFHINNKLSYFPEWKNHQFTPKYFEVDADLIEEAAKFRKYQDENYLYLNEVYEDERLIETVLKSLQQRTNIPLKVEITERTFYDLLKDPNSTLNNKAPEQYDDALKGQAKVCQKVFTKPVCVIAGAAGTGKTTILKSIIKSIEKAHGAGGIILLAPTGKASERIKEKTNKTASTIHSFLANQNRAWLNENFSFKRKSGKVDNTITTLIIDECSMIDLALFATLFRSINWNSVQRLILVGDPNQLPPIGRGKVFSDVVDWMKLKSPDNLGKLDINVRQLENKVKGDGNGILELAEIFIQEKQSEGTFDKAKQEQILKKIQQGGIIDKDLSLHYWKDMDDLESMLKTVIIADLETQTGEKAELDKLYNLWGKAIRLTADYPDPTYLQVLSPFRGEFYGTDYLNTFFQELFNNYQAKKGQLDNIALYDKVIQFRNRPKSNPISAYSWIEKKNVKIDIYNGEIGFVNPHPFDKKKAGSPFFQLKNFQVKFNRRDNFNINYGCRKDDYSQKIMFDEPVEENLELGYVISVHKAQGSEFNRVYCILPKKSSPLMSMELLYTAVTRAQKHLTIFTQEDVSTFISLSKIEKSNIRKINSSIFEFEPLPDLLFSLSSNWYEDQRFIATLSKYFVRSKSEMNIANILHLNNIPFEYEVPKFAPNGSMYLPDFTIRWQGNEYFWEHVGRLDLPEYKNHWKTKEQWYAEHFPKQLIVTYEGPDQTLQIKKILKETFNIELE